MCYHIIDSNIPIDIYVSYWFDTGVVPVMCVTAQTVSGLYRRLSKGIKIVSRLQAAALQPATPLQG